MGPKIFTMLTVMRSLYLSVIAWIIYVCATNVVFWKHYPLKHHLPQIKLLYTPVFDEYAFDNKQIISTNIGIVIPSYFNGYTLQYLRRILHNIYLSQMEFERESNPNNTANQIYIPSQIIISMSITPEYYQYTSNMSDILQFYIDRLLNNDSNRLQIFYHYNTSMNAAQNRNYGLSKINYNIAEYVGFFDMDDIMHPQRIGILYFILNANKNNIDFVFHAFIMNKDCKEEDLALDYITEFKTKSPFMDDNQLQLLSHSVSDRKAYKMDYCVAYYRSRTKGYGRFDIECKNEQKKRWSTKKQALTEEFVTFDRFYHNAVEQITFINYSKLITHRCENIESVKHNILGKARDVSCDYGTMAGGLEAFRNEKAVTRHHNGWPTMKASLAQKLKYDENWRLHGSYRGQDCRFNTDAYHEGAQIFHVGAYLGMYCHH